jgi:hypothetical protein
MMKVCPTCNATWAGGFFCPTCGTDQPLTDMATEAGKAHLVDGEMNRAVQAHYGERRGMVRTVVGLFSSFAVAAFLFRAGFGAAGLARFAWWFGAALVATLGSRGVLRHARGVASRAAGSASYVCPDEAAEAGVPAQPKGASWLRW